MPSLLDKINSRLLFLNAEIERCIEARLKLEKWDPNRRELEKQIYRLKGERKGLDWVIEVYN